MIKIFLVEDEVVIREAIHQMISWNDYGFEFVGEAGDGELALPIIRNVKPDVIITDIKMPFMDGLSLSRLVLKEFPATKIVIVSGYDDFKYAQEAISLGVEKYLLKPFSKNEFIKVLEEIKDKYNQDNIQKTYYEKFQSEIQEYEKNTRRDFFEGLVSGQMSLQDIYERAEKLEIDIMSQCYNIVLFSVNDREQVLNDIYSQKSADVITRLNAILKDGDSYLIFRNQIISYAVIVKGDIDKINDLTDQCVNELHSLFIENQDDLEWFISTGKPVERLSRLKECYEAACKAFVHRYMEGSRVFTYEDMKNQLLGETVSVNLQNINIEVANADMIRNFLCNALEDEVEGFTDSYIEMVGEEALNSKMFRQYIILFIHFCTASFIQQFGYGKEELKDSANIADIENYGDIVNIRKVINNILKKGIELREQNQKNKYKNMIFAAIKYIDENFADDSMTLNSAAKVANVSANHFSALFSQEMEQTFIEYLTEVRMNKAKELLRCTDKRSGEIAFEVGYKDPHYFSFLFKKLQGCTPSEYRNKKVSGK